MRRRSAPIVALALWAGRCRRDLRGLDVERLGRGGRHGVLTDAEAATADRCVRARARAAAGAPHASGSRPACAPDDRLESCGDQPADPRPPARRVPRDRRRAAEGARLRLRQPRRRSGGRVSRRAGRPRAGTPWREARWCALDLELTGLDPREDHIIAVGTVPIEAAACVLGRARYTLVSSVTALRTTARCSPTSCGSPTSRTRRPIGEARRRVLERLAGARAGVPRGGGRAELPVAAAGAARRAPARRRPTRRRSARLWLRAARRTPRHAGLLAERLGGDARAGDPPGPPRARRRADDRAGVHRAGEPPRRGRAADGGLAADARGRY